MRKIIACFNKNTVFLQNDLSTVTDSVEYVYIIDDLYSALEKKQPELVLLTISPDNFDETKEIIEYLHECYFKIRILGLVKSLTGYKIIELLAAGLDQYMQLPLQTSELKIRVQQLLHLHKLPKKLEYTLAPYDCVFSPETGLLTIKNNKTQLRRKESQLLHCLFQYKNQLVKRETLVSFAWNDADELPTRTTLDVYIRKIRMRLGVCSSCIGTVRGFGYILTERTNAA
ncbi:response regulator transcription factor [Candidatus Woesebacteria bacterium]|nr:response regulator transcription factor [Candidatus Woesebacteria bacterium]